MLEFSTLLGNFVKENNILLIAYVDGIGLDHLYETFVMDCFGQS